MWQQVVESAAVSVLSGTPFKINATISGFEQGSDQLNLNGVMLVRRCRNMRVVTVIIVIVVMSVIRYDYITILWFISHVSLCAFPDGREEPQSVAPPSTDGDVVGCVLVIILCVILRHVIDTCCISHS